jgi:hypothetical protein
MKADNNYPLVYPKYYASQLEGRKKHNCGYKNAWCYLIPVMATLTVILLLLTSCNPTAGDTTTETIVDRTSVAGNLKPATVTPTLSERPTDTVVPSPTPDDHVSPESWQEWPVVPVVRPEMKAIYERGLLLGNNQGAFSKIGDGEISTVWFLTKYDLGQGNYQLGSYQGLQTVITKFSGSFGHIGVAAGRGFSTTIILGPAPAEQPECQTGESRLDCELRTFHPSIAFISLGTNQIWEPEIFESELGRIIERLLAVDVVPILATKADNLEGDQHINQIISRLAYENNLPMWNFWLAVQGLPDHGLQPDREHLTYSYSDFNNPVNFQYAWPWRNLTALQVLDSVFRGVTSQP